ncbi:MAG: class I SAM-dependent methyltransferase [Chitinophagaceae bacterium]
MSQILHYNNCPVCASADIKNVLSVKDYTVSGEMFAIAECNDCSLRFTQDVPDEDSISPYYKSENYISHTNTSKGLINRLYQAVRKITLQQKRKLIEKTTGRKKGQLLDVGSGTGAFVNEMKENGWQVTGLEPDADAVSVAKQLYNLELKNINQFYKLPADSFDAITLWHVLEHVHVLPAYVKQLKMLLKNDGKLFIAVPNYTSKDGSVYNDDWAAYDVPRHLYHFSPKSIKVLVEKNGMKLLQHQPMWFDSFYISMLSSKYKNARLNDGVGQGKANLVTAFFNGIRSNIKAMNDVKQCSSVIYIIGK